MSKPVFIFDFDGTIADTRGYVVEISNRISGEYSYKHIDEQDVPNLKNKTAHEIIKYLKIPLLKLPAILTRVKKELQKGISDVRPFRGLMETLYELKKEGILIGILSSNSSENIRKFLKAHDLDIFDFIQTTPKVWSKDTSLKKLIAQHGLDSKKVIYIGDEIRDITAAKKLGLKVAAVTWGYNSALALKKHLPDFLINSPRELFQIAAVIA